MNNMIHMCEKQLHSCRKTNFGQQGRQKNGITVGLIRGMTIGSGISWVW